MATFATLYGEVQNNFSSDWLSRIKYWMNAEYHDLIARKPWSWTERVGLINAVAGQTSYSLVGNTAIPDFRALIDVTVQGAGGGKPMLIEAQKFDELTANATAYTATTGSHTLPVATINVRSTDGLPAAGFVIVNGSQLVTYTGVTATTLTGASGGTGSISAGSTVRGVLAALAPMLYTLSGDYPPETTSAAVVAGGVQTITIAPAYAAALNNAIRVRYYRGASSVELTADADVPMLPARHHDVLVQLATARGYMVTGSFLQAQEWRQAAELRIQQMIAEDNGMRHGDESELVERPPVAA